MRYFLPIVFLFSCSSTNDSGGHYALVDVYKSKGSIQCEDDGADISEMIEELSEANIDIICSMETGDGVAHPSVCGAPDGAIFVFTIRHDFVSTAHDLGYNKVSELPDYNDEPCITDQ